MNQHSESESNKDGQERGRQAPASESFDSDHATPQEAAEYREVAERGYGWGV